MSNNCPKKSNSRCFGFTLVEVMTALTIIMVGIVGVYGLINQTLSASKTASMQLTAAYLGKEGIEIVRNIRDSNYLKSLNGEPGYDQEHSWMSGLTSSGSPENVNCSTSTGCAADYSMQALSLGYANTPLKFNGSFYNYSTGVETPYKRIITVNHSGGNFLEVVVSVNWVEHGRNHSMTVRENLYNWWN
ncbi:MAG: prepilin-type N-terminal cleavage/methylation domain-containing protein [Minisyncoccales bacterium]